MLVMATSRAIGEKSFYPFKNIQWVCILYHIMPAYCIHKHTQQRLTTANGGISLRNDSRLCPFTGCCWAGEHRARLLRLSSSRVPVCSLVASGMQMVRPLGYFVPSLPQALTLHHPNATPRFQKLWCHYSPWEITQRARVPPDSCNYKDKREACDNFMRRDLLKENPPEKPYKQPAFIGAIASTTTHLDPRPGNL